MHESHKGAQYTTKSFLANRQESRSWVVAIDLLQVVALPHSHPIPCDCMPRKTYAQLTQFVN